jgi:hypothetical protein
LDIKWRILLRIEMTTTTFVDGVTVIEAPWLNDANSVIYNGVFQTNNVQLVTPILGTPVSGNISACTSTSMVMVTPVLGAATGTSLSTTGNQTISGTGKQGYETGSGGVVTQLTNKATTVVLNKTNGQITTNNANLLAATTVAFTLTNSTIEAGDIIVMNHITGGTIGSYLFQASTLAGSATIYVTNWTAGALAEAIGIRFAVIKVVAV